MIRPHRFYRTADCLVRKAVWLARRPSSASLSSSSATLSPSARAPPSLIGLPTLAQYVAERGLRPLGLRRAFRTRRRGRTASVSSAWPADSARTVRRGPDLDEGDCAHAAAQREAAVAKRGRARTRRKRSCERFRRRTRVVRTGRLDEERRIHSCRGGPPRVLATSQGLRYVGATQRNMTYRTRRSC